MGTHSGGLSHPLSLPHGLRRNLFTAWSTDSPTPASPDVLSLVAGLRQPPAASRSPRATPPAAGARRREGCSQPGLPLCAESQAAVERAGPRGPRAGGRGSRDRRGGCGCRRSLCTADRARHRPITFHFGEGQNRTVAGAERGHPGRVLLHGEPATSRALPPPLATSWGRAACLGPAATRPPPRPRGPVPGCRPLLSVAALTAATAPLCTSSPAGRAALHTRAHSLRLRACCKLQRHVRVHSPR